MRFPREMGFLGVQKGHFLTPFRGPNGPFGRGKSALFSVRTQKNNALRLYENQGVFFGFFWPENGHIPLWMRKNRSDYTAYIAKISGFRISHPELAGGLQIAIPGGGPPPYCYWGYRSGIWGTPPYKMGFCLVGYWLFGQNTQFYKGGTPHLLPLWFPAVHNGEGPNL